MWKCGITAVVLLAGCQQKGAVPLVLNVTPSSTATPVSPTEKATRDQAWVVAREADPLELARLADSVGADDLIVVASNKLADPEDRATAVRALAFVDDPTPALEALTPLALGSSELAIITLQTLAQAVGPRRHLELDDPGAFRRLGEALAVALPKVEHPVRRELIIRVLHLLSDRGAIDKILIPDH